MLGKRNKSTERERERESKGTRAREKSTKYTAVGSGQKKGVSKVCFFFFFYSSICMFLQRPFGIAEGWKRGWVVRK